MKILPISWFLKVKCVFNRFVYSLQDLLTWFIIFEYEDKRTNLGWTRINYCSKKDYLQNNLAIFLCWIICICFSNFNFSMLAKVLLRVGTLCTCGCMYGKCMWNVVISKCRQASTEYYSIFVILMYLCKSSFPITIVSQENPK